jgi:hypothetical protein
MNQTLTPASRSSLINDPLSNDKGTALRHLVELLADYVDRVPDDRLNAEHIDREALLQVARSYLRTYKNDN